MIRDNSSISFTGIKNIDREKNHRCKGDASDKAEYNDNEDIHLFLRNFAFKRIYS